MKKYYVLKEDNYRYYVEEGRGSSDKNKALRITSIQELITTIPVMKDWNWDYELYEVIDGKEVKVEDNEWIPRYFEWKKNNPEDYENLYSSSGGITSFIRTTSH